MRPILLFFVSMLVVSLGCKNDSKSISMIIQQKKFEDQIRLENTDQAAIQLYDKLDQLQAVLENVEVRVLGLLQRDIPKDQRENSKKKLRADDEWINFNKQRTIVKSKLEKHLKANYPEYKKMTSSVKREGKPLKVPKKAAEDE